MKRRMGGKSMGSGWRGRAARGKIRVASAEGGREDSGGEWSVSWTCCGLLHEDSIEHCIAHTVLSIVTPGLLRQCGLDNK